MHDHQRIELAIAHARQERAHAMTCLFRAAIRWLWTCPDCNDSRIMFRQRFENGIPVEEIEEIPCDYPGCTQYSMRTVLRKIRNGWVALFGIRRKLPRKRTPLSDDEQRLLRPPPVAILMNALHAPDRCGDAVIGKYSRLTKEFKR